MPTECALADKDTQEKADVYNVVQNRYDIVIFSPCVRTLLDSMKTVHRLTNMACFPPQKISKYLPTDLRFYGSMV